MHACTVHKWERGDCPEAPSLEPQPVCASRLSWAAFHSEQTEQIIPVVRPAAAKSEECSKHEVEATRVNEILAGAQE